MSHYCPLVNRALHQIELRRSNIDGIEHIHRYTHAVQLQGLKMMATDINSFSAVLAGLIRILFHLFRTLGKLVLMPFRIVGQHTVPTLQKGFTLVSFGSSPVGFLDCTNIISIVQIKCNRV